MLLKSGEGDRIDTQRTANRIVISESNGVSPVLQEKPAKTALFGPFELDLETGELRKSGVRIRLQNKPFQILKALIQQPGEVVTREQLRHHVWQGDTFVDFESGLNTAANRLRLALHDSAENPAYIETLPRIGYRFIAPVQFQAATARAELAFVHSPLAPTPVTPASDVTPPVPRTRIRAFAPMLLSTAALLVLVAAGTTWRRYAKTATGLPSFHQLTFRPGAIENARFTPTGEVIFSATWKGEPSRLYVMNLNGPEARQLPFGPGSLVSVSPSDEISFLHKVDAGGKHVYELAQAALYGGSSRVMLRDVRLADLGPDGKACIVRRDIHGYSLEYPSGKVLYQTSGWFGNPRISPDGSKIAVAEHPLIEDDAGSVLLINRDGKVLRLSEGWASLSGVAWTPRGDEVWFSAAKQGVNRQIYASDLQHHVRPVAVMPATLDLFDIGPSGQVLVGRSTPRLSMLLGNVKSLNTEDISWLDWSRVAAMSADGNKVLFDETGEGGGPRYSVYLHRRDRGTSERIGDGRAMDLSQDGEWILTGTREPSSTISLISAEDAKTKTISAPGFVYQSAYFLGSTRDLLVQLSQPSTHSQKLYIQNIDTGKLRELTDSSGLPHLVVAPDGSAFASAVSSQQLEVVHLPSGERTLIETPEPASPVSWANDKVLVVQRINGDRIQLDELDITTKKRHILALLPPAVQPVMHETLPVMLSSDLSTFAFSSLDHSITLFTAKGWS